MKEEKIAHRRIGPLEVAFRATGDGSPLIMFHGGEGDHKIYDKLQDALGSSLTAISFDQRDCGKTKYMTEPQPYTLKDVAYDAVLLMDAFGFEAAHIMGNSIGGVLAQLTAFYWPERVKHLILGLTWPADEQLQDLNPEGIAERSEYAAMGDAGLRSMAELMSSKDYVAAHPEIIEELKALSTPSNPDARKRRMAAFSTPIAVDPRDIQHETLIIAGGTDKMVPAVVTERIMSKIPRSRFELLPGAGHLAARQYPREMADLIKDFVSG